MTAAMRRPAWVSISAGGIEWDDPAPGFTVDLNAHGLLVHEASGFAERDISGSLLWDRDRFEVARTGA